MADLYVGGNWIHCLVKTKQYTFPDTMVCTGCCATLDHIVTYLFKQLTQKGDIAYFLINNL